MLRLLALAATAAAYSLNTETGPDGWVEDHNYHRCRHGADPLVWDAALAAKAQDWVDWMASGTGTDNFVHSDSYVYPDSLSKTDAGVDTGLTGTWPASGENLAYAQGLGDFDCDSLVGPYDQHHAVCNWYKKYSECWTNPSDPEGWKTANCNEDIGHFTTLVWKGITKLGCASAGTLETGMFYACEYSSDACDEGVFIEGTDEPNFECSDQENPPAGLPSWNMASCVGPECVEALTVDAHTCEAAPMACDGGCCDDPAWRNRAMAKQQDCQWVADKNTRNRCKKQKSDDNVKARLACRATCGTCDKVPACKKVGRTTQALSGDCCDSTTWTKRGDALKDCDWVALKPDPRCNFRENGAGTTKAEEACPVACKTCPTCAPCPVSGIPTCEWYKNGKKTRTCGWAAENPQTRCAMTDAYGVPATQACCSCQD